MPQVSRKPLPKDLYKEITDELWWVLTNVKRESEMAAFLGDLLTDTEKLMLAKRLAIANLLMRGWTWQEICDLLHVSSATVNGTKRWLGSRGQGFRLAVKKLERKERWEEFWSRVDELLPTIPKSKSDMRGRAKLRYGN